MAFKMKGSPMQRNFPSAFPKEGRWAKIKEKVKNKVEDFKGSKRFKDFKYNINRLGEEISDTWNPNKDSLADKSDAVMKNW